MKKYFTTLLLLLFTDTVFCQSADTASLPATADYLKKSKLQKTTAWVLTAAGTTGLLTTLIADAGQAVGGAFVTVVSVGTVEPEYKSYTGYYVASATALVTGIAYFIAASNSKQKARALQTSFKMETAPVLLPAGVGQQHYPSLSLSRRL